MALRKNDVFAKYGLEREARETEKSGNLFAKYGLSGADTSGYGNVETSGSDVLMQAAREATNPLALGGPNRAAQERNASERYEAAKADVAERTKAMFSPYAANAAYGYSDARKELSSAKKEMERLGLETDPTFWERVKETVTGGGKQYVSGNVNAAGVAAEAQKGTAMSSVYNAQAEALDDQIAALETTLSDPTMTARDVAETQEALRIAREQRALYGGAIRSGENTAGEVYKIADEIAQSGAQDIARAKEGTGFVGGLLVDLGAQGVQMAADRAIGLATGVGSLSAMGARTFGSGAQEARQNGADLQQAVNYGIGSAAVEVGTEMLFDGLAGIYGKGAADEIVENAINRLTTNEAARKALNIAAAAGGESIEELLSGIANPLLQTLYNGKSVGENYSEMDASDILYDMLVGGLMGGLGGSVEIARDALLQDTAQPAEQILQQAAQEIAENETRRSEQELRQQEAARRAQETQEQTPEGNLTTEETKPAEAQETAKNESFEQAAKRVLGKEGAKAAIEAYDGSVPSDRYLGAWLTYYMRGVSGNEIDARYAGDLTPEQAGKAYQSGVADAKASLERDKRASQFASVAGDDSGLVFDDYVNGMDSAEADVINLSAKDLGLRVGFAGEVAGGRANAQIRGYDVLIEKNNPNPTAFLYGHEITHRMQELAPEEYRAFRDSLGDEVKAVAQVKMDRFGYTYEEALDEAAADYAGRLINDDRLLDKFIADHRDDRNLLQKLVDAIRELIGRLTDSAEQKKLRAAEQKLTAAYNAAAEQAEKLTAKENASAESESEARSSIKELPDGKKYVQADRQVIFGNDPDSWSEQLEDYINSKIRKGQNVQLIGADGEVLTLTARTAGKIASRFNNDGTTMSDAEYERKVSAGSHIDELVQVSMPQKQGVVADENKKHGEDASGGWKYRNAYFLDHDGTYYLCNISVQIGKDGNAVYNVGRMQKRTFPTIYGSSAEGGAQKRGKGSDDNVAQKEPVVKPKSSLKEETEKSAERVNVNYDEKSESANAIRFSRKTWNESDYVTDTENAAKDLSKALGISAKKAKKFISEVNSIAKIIADDRERLDYEAAPDMSSFVSNAEYGGSIDFSTICKKRRVLTGTLEAIQQAMPDKALTADEVLKIRDMMQSRGYEVSCGLCYVEGSRAKMGGFAKQFINLFKKYNPDAEWIPDMYDVNTPTGVEQMRLRHKDVYEQYEYFWNHHGRLRDGDPNLFASQQKPKLYQTATEYRGEILQKFKNADTVAQKNLFGGLRLQSFSDFEIIHLLDTMQVITDMSRVGLAGQAYTKVPDFAWAVGGTGLKVNLSLIAKGVDENGRVILDEVEGMKRADAEALRNAYSKNVGTILVVFDDAQLKAAMNDPFIDFIIPFHRSQWAKKYYDILGLPKSTKDYTRYQNEKMLAGGKKGNLMPNEYWDFSKSGKENAERYLALCAEMGKRPKFRNLLVDNGDGSWSLQPDGSTDGYWKLLIDFKMYDNKGKGSPQMPVTPQFNMTEAKRMLQDYNGDHEKFPVAQDVVDDFVGGRFSEKGSENDFEIARLRSQNETLRERVDYWKGQTKRTVNPTVRAADTKRMAREIVKAYSATTKADDIGARLQELGNYIVRGGDKTGELNYSTLKERAVEIARDVINSAEELNDEYADVYREIRSRARKGIKVSDSVRSDIPDFNLWRKDHMGDLTIKENGVPLDTLYEEMADIAPWLFPEANGGDQLLRIADAIDNLRPVYENPHSYDMAAAIEYCANDIIDGLLGENVRQTPKTFADRQAAKLDEAKAEGRRRVAEVREQKNAQIERLREQNRAAVEQAVKRERARRGEMLQNLKDHYKEVENRKRERRADSAARTKLLNIAKRLKNKKLPAVTRERLNQYIGDLDTASKGMTGKTVEKLSELEDWYLDQKENNPDFISDPRIENALRRLHSKHIADMSAEDVADLTDILLNIENEIRTQREAIDSKMRHDTYVAGVEAMRDIENSGGLKGGMFDKLFINNTLSPVREMHRLTGYNDSDPLYVLTQELADGQRKMFDYQRRASERFKRWTENKKFVDRVRGKNAEEMKIAGVGADGPVEVSITPAMRMSLYLHSKNDQNLRHIAGGGITVPDMKLYKQGKIEEAYNKGTKIKLTPSQVRSITAGMSAEERAFADAASAYFNGMSRDAINETSEKLKGYSIAGVENYFPIDTDKSFVKKDFDALKFDGTLEGMGFLKERINASSPIMLYDLDRVLRRSIDQHSKYVGLAIPVRNFNKVWGVNKSSFDADGNRNGFESSVQQKMKQMWDDAGYKYVEKLMSDLQNGHSEQNDFDKLLRKVRSNYAGAVLTLNASVAMKQAASYPTAAAVVGWKPLAKALRYVGRVDTDLVNKYTPLLWYRSQGFSTQELGDMAKQDRQLPKLLNWVQGMDLLTTKTLWKAAEFYVQDEMKVKRGSDGFYPAVADVYNRIIEETQPNYTTMQRPQLLRTENTLLQSLSMFKTQPFQNFNVLYDALGNLDAKRRAAINGTPADMDAYRNAQKQARRAVSSQVVQLAVFAGMTAAWNLFRGRTDKYDDDDENVTAASVLRRIGHDMLGSAASMIPFGSDVWEMLNGWLGKDTYYGFDEITSSSINDLVNAVSKAGKSLSSMFESAANGEEIDFDTQRKTWDSVLKAASKVVGVPFENVENLFNAVYRKAAIAAGGRYKGQYAYLKLTAGKSSDYYNNLYDAYKNDKAAYEEIYADMLKDGYTVDKIKSAMETRMKTDAGVTSVNDLDDRFLSPEQQTRYDSELAAIEGTSVWRVANDRAKENTLERLYELAAGTSDGRKLQEKIDGGASVGLSDTEYLLYTAALDTVDKPTDSGKYGTFTQDEIAAAIRAVPGLTGKERSYLWLLSGSNAEKDPWNQAGASAYNAFKNEKQNKQQEEKTTEKDVADTNESSAIKKAEYDPETQTAYITWSNGKTYTYTVSQSEWDAFKNSPSKGSYANKWK